MAERINRAIELLSQGKPIYYAGGHTGSPWTADRRPSATLTAHDSPVLTHEQGTACFQAAEAIVLHRYGAARRSVAVRRAAARGA